MAECSAASLICLGEGLFFSYENPSAAAQTVAAITSLSWSIESNMSTTTTKYHEQVSESGSGTVRRDDRVTKDSPVCTIEMAGAVLSTAQNALVVLFESAVKAQSCAAFKAKIACAASGLNGVTGNAYVSSFSLTGETEDIVNWKATIVSVGTLT